MGGVEKDALGEVRVVWTGGDRIKGRRERLHHALSVHTFHMAVRKAKGSKQPKGCFSFRARLR